MNIKINYSENSDITEKEIQLFCSNNNEFEIHEVSKFEHRGSAIDLISTVEIIIKLIILKQANSFISGFIGEDWFENIGKQTRLTVLKNIQTTKHFIKKYYNFFIKNKSTQKDAHVISVMIESTELYIVLNHSKMNDELLSKISKAIVDTYSKISLGYIGVASPVCQLYPDFEDNEWRYLFIPTNSGFGNYVDRYYDLKLEKIIEISDKKEFLQKYKITEDDKNKIIINALREL
ncbi:MAG: hypothetical protein PF574_07930 [Candidatus Delongbacteria bacterium]|jgi:hypothetical protein|nr:hypothetical protein [Candidatus Delongbacteria bacterium]